MRILIVNQHSMNFGDDAAGGALVEMLMESPRVDLVQILYNGIDGQPGWPDRVSVPKGVRFGEIGLPPLLGFLLLPRLALRAFRLSGLPKLVDVIKSSDVVLVAPSGANMGVYRDWVYLLRLLVVVRAGGKPVFYLNSIGASGSHLFDLFARMVLARSRIYVRERASKQYIEKLGFSADLGPDTAFALGAITETVRSDVISVVPSELSSWHRNFKGSGLEDLIIRDVATEIGRFATENGLRVEILPHLRTETERNFNARFAKSIAAGGLDQSQIAVLDVGSFREYDHLIATSRMVVGGRYHSVVLAAKNHRPFVSLGYENKMAEVCRYLDLNEFNIDLLKSRDQLSEGVRTRLVSALAREDEIVQQLSNCVRTHLARNVRKPLEDLRIL